MSNPYSSPESMLETSADSQPILWWPLLGLMFGGLCLSIAIALVVMLACLFLSFPDLQDTSPNTDAYWPKSVALVAGCLTVLAVVIGLPTFKVSAEEFWRPRKKLLPDPELRSVRNRVPTSSVAP